MERERKVLGRVGSYRVGSYRVGTCAGILVSGPIFGRKGTVTRTVGPVFADSGIRWRRCKRAGEHRGR